MTDDYRPRQHDHLVEPVFGGLGVEPEPPRNAFARFLAWLRRLFRRPR
ncbi:MAG: hypothetical protein ABL998_15025 [Planctomycetota bacterium]